MARRSKADEIENPGNPVYDISSTQLAKFRAKAERLRGLRWLDREERVQYANAVEQAVLAAQRAALAPQREVLFVAGCASGTFHNDGGAIIKAVLQQQRAALSAYPAKVRRARTPQEWAEMYRIAMVEKRRRRKQEASNG